MSKDRAQLPATLTVHVPLTFTVRGGRKTIIGEIAHAPPKTRFDDSIAKALARAYRWKQKLEEGTYSTVKELAGAENIHETYVTKLLRLNLLAPDIVEAALGGRTNLTVQSLSETISAVWEAQRSELMRRAARGRKAKYLSKT